MFALKKALTPFLLPPGLFMVLLFLSGLWFLYKKNIRAGGLNFIMGGLMWLLTLTPVSNIMIRGLESGMEIPKHLSGDVIILLGGGGYDKAPDFTGTGSLSSDALARVVTAVRLQKRFNVPIIVSGGQVYKHIAPEAIIIRRFLIDLGVPPDKIIVESKSRDTLENAKYSIQICDTRGYKNPILLTSAYHLKRSILSFKKFGKEVIPFPAIFHSWDGRKYLWIDYLPGSFKYTRIAIKEYLGLIYTKYL